MNYFGNVYIVRFVDGDGEISEYQFNDFKRALELYLSTPNAQLLGIPEDENEEIP